MADSGSRVRIDHQDVPNLGNQTVESDATGAVDESLAMQDVDDHPVPKPSHKKRKRSDGKNEQAKHPKVNSGPCPWPGCGKVLKRNMKVHMRVHTGERPHACDFQDCDAKFTQSGNLKAHKRRHTGERPYVCDFPDCDASFAQSSPLKAHQRSHTGEHPYACDFPDCDAKFTTSSNLKSHQRTHTIERPFACDFQDCDKAFARLDHLKIHQRTHTGERPYACDFPDCGATFITSGHLKRHQDVLHDHDYIAAVPGASKMSCAFLDALEYELGVKFQHIHYGKRSVCGSEHPIHRTKYHADGHAQQSKISRLFVGQDRAEVKIEERGLVVEFLGEPFHGYEGNQHADLCNHLGHRFGDLYDKTMKRNDEIVARGYTVIYIWSKDYLAWKGRRDQSLLCYCRRHVLRDMM